MGKFTEEITDALYKDLIRSSVQNERPSDFCKSEIDHEIDRRLAEQLPGKGGYQMKKWSLKRAIIIAAAACMLIGGTVLAAGGMGGIYSSSMHTDKYNKYDKLPKAMKEAGMDVALPEEMAGYRYVTAEVVNNESWDDVGNVEDSWKGIYAEYMNDEGKEISVSIDPAAFFTDEVPEEHTKAVWETDGTNVYYGEYTSITLSPDHELTQEEEDSLGPDVVVSYGDGNSDPVRIQTVIFTRGEYKYCLLGIGTDTPSDEFHQMAEIIAAEN